MGRETLCHGQGRISTPPMAESPPVHSTPPMAEGPPAHGRSIFENPIEINPRGHERS